MKKVILGLFALTLTAASFAQTETKDVKHGKDHFKGERMMGGKAAEELNLTDAQKAKVKSLSEDFKKQMQDLKKNGSITVDQQKAKHQELAQQYKQKFEAILTPEQKQKSAELKKNFAAGKGDFGKKGFDKMGKDLNLTADQSAKMKTYNDSFRSQVQTIKSNSSLTDDQKKEQVKNLAQQHKKNIESLLTEDQKQQLKDRLKNRPNRKAVK